MLFLAGLQLGPDLEADVHSDPRWHVVRRDYVIGLGNGGEKIQFNSRYKLSPVDQGPGEKLITRVTTGNSPFLSIRSDQEDKKGRPCDHPGSEPVSRGHPLLQMTGITKRFPGVVRQRSRIDFDVRGGEIHTLFGRTGAGRAP